MARIILAIIGGVMAVSMSAYAQSSRGPADDQRQADQLVLELRQFPASLPATVRSDGSSVPIEEQRRRVYGQIRALGTGALPALARGLAGPDVQVRRNVALFLNVVAGNWYEASQPRLNIQACLPGLIAAVKDRDARVRALSAQAIGEIGPSAVAAVPSLVALLGDSEEGSRNSACIGLAGIGPAAREALPALRRALSDPSADVRRFAQRAIGKIEAR